MSAQASRCVLSDPACQSFVRLLQQGGHPIAAVREQRGDKIFLAVPCGSEAEAQRRTGEIVRALDIDPAVLARLDLGQWMARRIEGSRLLLYWTGVELHSLH